MRQALLADLELRFDHEQQVGVLGGRGEQWGQDEGQGDERQVADDELRSGHDRPRVQGAHVGAVQDRDPLIGLKRPCELAVADIDRRHVRGAAPQQDVREAPGGRPGVQASASFQPRCQTPGPEGVECAGELAGAAGDVVVALGRYDLERLRRVDLHDDGTVERDMPVDDESGCVRARASEPASDELGVETNEACHAIPMSVWCLSGC